MRARFFVSIIHVVPYQTPTKPRKKIWYESGVQGIHADQGSKAEQKK